jgi:hypothetical protein
MATSTVKKFTLTVLQEGKPGAVFRFKKDKIAIGRIAANDLALNDRTVSRNHAHIFVENGQFIIQDINNNENILHNSARVNQATLKPGDKIGIGRYTFEFSIEDEGSNEDGARKSAGAKGKEKKSSESASSGRSKDRDSFDAKSSRQSGRSSKSSLPLKKFALIAFPLIILLIMIGKLATKPKTSSPGGASTGPNAAVQQNPDLSNIPIPLPSVAVIGNNMVDRAHKDKAIFTFSYNGGRASLLYEVAGIDVDGEIKIYLNGYEIGTAPLSLQRWSTQQRLVLPTENLSKTETNKIIFDNTLNPPKDPSAEPQGWGVRRVEVKEEMLPPYDPEEAQKNFKLGEAKYDERKIQPGNLFASIQYFSKALDYLEAAPSKPPLYNSIKEKMRVAKDDLDKLYEKYNFSFRIARRQGDYKKAEQMLLSIMEEIPDRRDPRYLECDKSLRQIRAIMEQ